MTILLFVQVTAYYEDGFKAGKKEGKIEDAKAMLANNVAPDLVAKYTGLNAEEVEALRQQN